MTTEIPDATVEAEKSILAPVANACRLLVSLSVFFLSIMCLSLASWLAEGRLVLGLIFVYACTYLNTHHWIGDLRGLVNDRELAWLQIRDDRSSGACNRLAEGDILRSSIRLVCGGCEAEGSAPGISESCRLPERILC